MTPLDHITEHYGSILTGNQIIKEWKAGNITIDPFNVDNINPNSYNVTLGNTIGKPKLDTTIIDSKHPFEVEKIALPDDGWFIVAPNSLILAETKETIGSDMYVPILTGRSSAGRMGVFTHCTGNFGDIGYSGIWTMQLTSVYPIKLYAGQSIAQIYFLRPYGLSSFKYDGHYNHADGLRAPHGL